MLWEWKIRCMGTCKIALLSERGRARASRRGANKRKENNGIGVFMIGNRNQMCCLDKYDDFD